MNIEERVKNFSTHFTGCIAFSLIKNTHYQSFLSELEYNNSVSDMCVFEVFPAHRFCAFLFVVINNR
jgi:hypothetical protein